MALIFYLSSHSSFPIINDKNLSYWADFVIKKIAHMIVYGVLMFFWFRALNDKLSIKKAIVWALIITVLYAVSDEYHQSFVPDREGRVRDVLIDSLAAAISGWIIIKTKKRPERDVF